MGELLTEPKMLALSATDFFLLTVISFGLLYFSFSTLAYFLFQSSVFKKYQRKEIRSEQIKLEIQRSSVSILMFGVLSFPMYFALQSGFFKIIFQFDVTVFLAEILVLFLWNEIYFYGIHRIYHLKSFFSLHRHHHFSHVPTPFSAYSFHWSEGFLLGAVMPMIMCFHHFQIYSLLVLPLMSIVLNVLGHSNIDFFPRSHLKSLVSFSKRHSRHHQFSNSNFGFFLPYLDQIFKTAGTDDEQQ